MRIGEIRRAAGFGRDDRAGRERERGQRQDGAATGLLVDHVDVDAARAVEALVFRDGAISLSHCF